VAAAGDSGEPELGERALVKRHLRDEPWLSTAALCFLAVLVIGVAWLASCDTRCEIRQSTGHPCELDAGSEAAGFPGGGLL